MALKTEATTWGLSWEFRTTLLLWDDHGGIQSFIDEIVAYQIIMMGDNATPMS